MLISAFWSAARYIKSLSNRQVDILVAVDPFLTSVTTWASNDTINLRVSKNRGTVMPKVKEGAQWAVTRKGTCHILMWMLSWRRSFPRIPPSLSFSPRLFVCFCHRDVTVVLTAPPLLNVYKAEVGQIWLKDIQFCSYFTWVKIKPEGVWEEPSLLAINMYQLPTIPGHDASYFAHFSFFFFFVLSLPLLLTKVG